MYLIVKEPPQTAVELWEIIMLFICKASVHPIQW
jgi:hypothetical protein